MKKSWLIFLLFPALTFGSCVRKSYRPVYLSVEDGVDRHYLGEYRDDQRYLDLAKAMPDMRREALAHISKKAGLQRCGSNVLVSFRDGRGVKQGIYVKTGTRELDGEIVEVITFFVDRLLSGQMDDLEKSLHHEIVHATMRSCMEDRYKSLPKWFREGSAVWIAGQLPDRAEYILGNTLFSEDDPFSLLNGIESSRHSTDDYMEDSLLFEYIRQTKGPQAPIQLIKKTMTGLSPKKAFTEVSGQDWPALHSAFQQWARNFVAKKLQDAFHDEYQTALAAFKEDKAKARDLFSEFAKKHPDSFLTPLALYRAGKYHNFTGQFQEAIDTLNRLFGEKYKKHSYLLDDALVQIGWSLTELKKYPEAILRMEQLIRDYPDRPTIQGRAYYRIGLAYFESGKQFEAIRPLRKSLSRLSGKTQESCLVMLIKAYVKNRDWELAKDTLEKLESWFPKSKQLPRLRELVHKQRP